ncbi:MAG: hypothetical protein ACP6IY_21195 [Promethearchaeia archaeon]
MEIEKKRENTWKIKLKKNKAEIEITSVEIGGEVRNIKLSLRINGDYPTVEMNKEEFFNFLSVLNAFKEIIIGDEFFNYNNEQLVETILKETEPLINTIDEQKDSILKQEKNDENFEDEMEDLNPEEWDPW